MAKSVIVQARVEPELKRDVEKVLASVGLNATQAINLFYRQIKLQQGLPFPVHIPNAETVADMEAARRGEVEYCDSIMDLLK